MSFSIKQKVLFRHCDPAGIVFYPRYFEMINDTIEAFFESALGFPWETSLKTGGIPTAQISATFVAPSRYGDILNLELRCKSLGRSSVNLELAFLCGENTRMTASSTLVNVDVAGRPVAWPKDLRAAIETQLQGEA